MCDRRRIRLAGPARSRRRAFTLIEMIVVVGIILLILGITLPSISALWEERKLSESENTIQGLLMTARARSLRAAGSQSGLLFFVDRNGAQRVVSIQKAEPPNSSDMIVWQDVFEPTPDRDYVLPAPIRVVPRYVVDKETGSNKAYAFSAVELANNNFMDQPDATQIAQRHRNYFTLIYSGDGQLITLRDVLIRDVDTEDGGDGDGLGDVTGMRVGGNPWPDTPDVENYWLQEGGTVLALDPIAGLGRTVANLVSDDAGDAINFPSVDGRLVYDDGLFNEAGVGGAAAEQKRDFLIRNARPFYINRWTGSVIRGPIGEAESPQP